MATADSILDRQHETFRLISRTIPNFKNIGVDNIKLAHIETRLTALETNWKKFQEAHEKLVQIKVSPKGDLLRDHDYFKNDLFGDCEEAFLDAKSEILEFRNNLVASSSHDRVLDQSSIGQTTNSSRRLPKINLPKFSGKFTDWCQFRDLFISMVSSNTDLTSVEKLHYLKSSVSSEPAQLIKNIAITEENFNRAWEILVSRYENKRLLIDSHLATLFGIKQVNQESSSELKRLLGDTKEALGALETLGCPVNHWDHILVYMIVRKLDSESLKDWEKRVGETLEPPSFANLDSFLIGRTHTLESLEQASTRSIRGKGQSNSHSFSVKSHATAQRGPTCTFCHQNHYISSCLSFKERPLSERKEFASSQKLCFNCLGPHPIRECRTIKRCQTCGRRHHTLLHANIVTEVSRGDSSQPSDRTLTTPPSVPSMSTPSTASHSAQPQIISRSPVILATVIVRVAHPESGRFLEARALLDPGSESSFITESLCQQLRLPKSQASIPVIGVGAQQSGVTRGIAVVNVQSRVDTSFSYRLNALVLPRLTSFLPSFRLLDKNWPHLEGLCLADPNYDIPRQIDLILGADIYSHVILENICKGAPGTPIAQNTRLGWVLSGSVPFEATVASNFSAVQGFQCSLDSQLNDCIQKFWLQEEIAKPVLLNPDDKKCEDFFRQTVTRDASGRYIVRLPFKTDVVKLGNSRSYALRMFFRLENQFKAQPNFKIAYTEFLREYHSLGHMSRAVDPPKDVSRVFYLPHHGVFREASTTTKLRVVFNGSQKTSNGHSLNDNLLNGQKLQLDLADVLLLWRSYRIVFSADIVKMYRQIRVHKNDWDFQRILWRETENQPIEEYHLNTVTYGLSSAPYLAIRALHQLAEDEGSKFPLAREIIIQNMYVDDILSGADSLEESRQKVLQVTQLFQKGGFQLQKWATNVGEIIEDIAEANRAVASSRSLGEDSILRTLGLVWDSNRDLFTFTPQRLPITERSDITKRKVLSQISQLFDPLGWLAPILIRAKVFMQTLWCAKLSWDDPLPEDLASKWQRFLEDLLEVSLIRVPRWINTSAMCLGIEIHGFSDASQTALAAVIYLRAISENGEIRVSLLCAKTKVAPLRKITIPRLELCAALLLVRQVRHIVRVLNLSSAPIHLWTDSTVALAWIRGHPARWKDFVRNRVTEIQELERSRWHHVGSAENPADIASRGATPRQLQDSRLWNAGPTWLNHSSIRWPVNSQAPPSSDCKEEEKQEISISHSSIPLPIWELVFRYSNLTRLLRITARCQEVAQRFKSGVSKTKEDKFSRDLTTHQLEKALLFWVKKIQNAYFANELSEFKRNSQLSRTHSLTKLAPFIDANGFLRVGGRLENTHLTYDEKHPFILPGGSEFSKLLIHHYHRLTLHGGTQLTLATLRQKFWVLGGRVPVRRFIHRCVVCTRHRAITSTQLMGQLPSSRVSPSRPFLHSGVDYAGPFATLSRRSRGAKTTKSYIVIFVCFSTSAVHLELVSDYSTDAFLAAYKRFVSRRGIPATISSDCGKNLVGADAELKRLLSASTKEFQPIANELASHGTQWKFNPPSAPHFGGKWEAGVKSVKFHLKRVIGATTLTFEEFSTLLSQIEAVLNSRPLCAITEDSSDLSILTPGHFLIGSALNAVPEPSLAEIPIQRLSRWQLLHQKMEHFWRRWNTDYLQSLQNLVKWRQPEDNIKVGTIVLIKNENLPPAVWPLAKVVETHPGEDGHVRVVTVKTSTSMLRRSITKICVLPVTSN